MFWIINAKHWQWFQGWARRNELKIISKKEENNKLRVMVVKA